MVGVGAVVFFLLLGGIFLVGNWLTQVAVVGLLALLWYKWVTKEDTIPEIPLRKNEALEEFYWSNSRGDRLYGRIHFPQQLQDGKGSSPRGVIFYFHGLNNWIDRPALVQFGERVASRGYYFVTFDQQGFGRSVPGTTKILSYIKDWRNFILDGHDFIAYIYKTYSSSHNLQSLPAFIMGLSMGGTIALHLELSRHAHPEAWKNFKGMILLAPGIVDNMTPPWWIMMALRVFLWFGGGWMRLGPPGRKLGWTVRIPDHQPDLWPLRSPKWVEAYNEYVASPFCSYPKRMVLSTGRELMRLTEDLRKKLHQVDSPFLIVHGLGDALILVEGSRLLMEKAQTKDKTLKEYPHVCHCLFDDPLWFEMEKDVFDWIENRSSLDAQQEISLT